jgi:hypothetical protein
LLPLSRRVSDMFNSFRRIALQRGAWLGLAVAALGGCGDSGAATSPGVGSSEPEPARPPLSATGCTTGSNRVCHVELGKHGDVINCAIGTQSCVDEHWSACMVDPARGTTSVPAPPPKVAGLREQALAGSSTTCADNPCDPYCLTYDDVPDDPITTTPESPS